MDRRGIASSLSTSRFVVPLPSRQNELDERRKALEGEERDLDTRYKKAAANLDAENKAARAELAAARKKLAREKGELASKARNSAAEAEAAARKVKAHTVFACMRRCSGGPAGC